MGFGSYGESEQKDRDVDTGDNDGIVAHETDHDGELSFESDADTASLIDQRSAIKDDENP